MSRIDQKEEFFDLPERREKTHPDHAHKKGNKGGSTHERVHPNKGGNKNKNNPPSDDEVDYEPDYSSHEDSQPQQKGKAPTLNPKGLKKVQEAENPPPLERHLSNVDDMEKALYKNQLAEYSQDVIKQGGAVMWKLAKISWNFMLTYLWFPILFPIFQFVTGHSRLTTFITETYEWIVDAVFGKTMASIVKFSTRVGARIFKFAIRAIAYAIVIAQYAIAFFRGSPQREAQNVRDLLSMNTVKTVLEAGKNSAMQLKDVGMQYMTKYWNQLQSGQVQQNEHQQQTKRKRTAAAS